jgi:hypothetical protein
MAGAEQQPTTASAQGAAQVPPTAPAPAAEPPYTPSFPSPREDAGGVSPYLTPHLAAFAREMPPPSSSAPPSAPPQQAPAPHTQVDFQELLGPELARPTGRSRPPAPRSAAPEQRTVRAGSHSRARAGVERSLRRYGVSDEFAGELIDTAAAHTLPLAPRAGLAQAVSSTLAQRIPMLAPLPAKGAAIVLVGAGGSGKTTCCAALLAAYRAASTLPARFATLAHEAEGEELRMILTPEIVKPARASSARALRALRQARDGGLAILDTPPLSPAEPGGVRELARLIAEIKPERVVVALPATLGATAAAQLLEALAPLGAHALAITHADETDQLGVAVEAACRHGLAPEYMVRRGRRSGWRLQRVDPAELAARMLP